MKINHEALGKNSKLFPVGYNSKAVPKLTNA